MQDQVSPVLFTTFTTNSHHVTASQVASLHVLPETRNLAVIMRGGDITMIPLDDEDPTVGGLYLRCLMGVSDRTLTD